MATAPSPQPPPAEAQAQAQAPAQTPAQVPAQEVNDDFSDSTYGDEESITASVTSSIYAYEREHGRSYHAYRAGEKQYVLPNDEPELDRLDLQYHAVKLVLNEKLFLAPVKNPGRILDCGTGTGIWAMDAGDQFPQAEVTGIDLSPVQPSWVPPNVKFFVDDFEQPWGFPENHFDLVHGRLLIAGITDWPAYLAQCYRHMKPGGYVEAQEVLPVPKTDDDSFPPDSAMQEWARVIYEGTAKLGLNIRVPSTQIKTWMEQAGFEDVTVVDFKLPLGPWSKEKHLREAGNAEAMSLRDNLQGVTLRLWEKGLGRSYEELEVFLVKVRKEFDDKSIHAYFPFHVLYGRKPETEKSSESQAYEHQASEIQVSENQASVNQTSENQAAEKPVSQSQAAESQASVNQTPEHRMSENHVSQNEAAENQAA